MRSGKELLHASKQFAGENRLRSWLEILGTLSLAGGLFVSILFTTSWITQLGCSIACGLIYVRLFVIYHDYEHRAILQNSAVAHGLMWAIGIYLLAPETIWNRSHEHHHNNNSKLTISGIGSYPTISKDRFLGLTKGQQRLYLINRHPLTVMFAYVTLFIYWLNLKSFIQSPSKHMDSLLALVLHLGAGISIFYFLGVTTFLLLWILPFFLSFAIGSYLFYCQHNFATAKFRENHDWSYVNAAIASTSFMTMNPVMQWVTANIGYHHVHHLNSRIPFYRLIEAMESMPELNNPPTTSWSPREIFRCFQVKLWDVEKNKMITMRQLHEELRPLPTAG